MYLTKTTQQQQQQQMAPSTCPTGLVYYWSVFLLPRDMDTVKKVKAETSSSFVSHFFLVIV